MEMYEGGEELGDVNELLKTEPSGFGAGWETAQLSYGGNLEEETYKKITKSFPDYTENTKDYEAWINANEWTFGNTNIVRYEKAIENDEFRLDSGDNIILGSNGVQGMQILFDMDAMRGALLARKHGYSRNMFNAQYGELAKKQAGAIAQQREGTSTLGYVGGVIAGHMIQPETFQEIATSPAKIMGSTVLKGMAKAFVAEGAVGLVGEVAREQRIREHMEKADLDYTLWDSVQQILLGAGLGGTFRAIGSGTIDKIAKNKMLKKINKDVKNPLDKEIVNRFFQREEYKLTQDTNKHLSLIAKAREDMDNGRPVDIADATDIDINTKTNPDIEEISLRDELAKRDVDNGYEIEVKEFEKSFAEADEIKPKKITDEIDIYDGMATKEQGDELIKEMGELDPEIKAEMEAVEAELAQPIKEPIIPTIPTEFLSVPSISSTGKKIKGITIIDKENITAIETEMIDRNTLEVFNVYVPEELRRQGKGKELYNQLIEEAKKQGYSKIQSDSSVSEPAVKVWESLGATKTKSKITSLEDGITRKAKQYLTEDNKPMFTLDITKKTIAPTATTGNIVSRAQALQGNKYVWGGTDLKKGADCSGFVQSIHKEQGINLPRTAWGQAKGTQGKNIAFNDMQIGDTIYFKPSQTGKKYAPVTHTGIITDIKDGKFIMTHAKGKKYGTVTEELSPGYIDRFYSAKRFTEEGVSPKVTAKTPTPKEVKGKVVIDEEITPDMEQTLLKQEELDTIEFNKMEEVPEVTPTISKKSEAAKARVAEKRELLEKEYGADEDIIREKMKVTKKRTLKGEEYKGMTKAELARIDAEYEANMLKVTKDIKKSANKVEDFQALPLEEQTEVMKRIDKKTLDEIMPFVKPETIGALYGFEQDEDGYWTYNVAKGALGAAGVHIAGKAFTSKKMKEVVTKYMKEYI